MGLGLGLLGAVAALLGQSIGFSAQLQQWSQSEQELSAVVALMQQDISRFASLGRSVAEVKESAVNPFKNSLHIAQHRGELANSCLLFGYDTNGNGKMDTDSPNELLGFRLKDSAIEIRQRGAKCDEGGWQDLTDTRFIRVTRVEFEYDQVQQASLQLPTLTIRVEGYATAQPKFKQAFVRQEVLINGK